MPVMASRDTRWRTAVDGSASRRCWGSATTGGVSDRQGPVAAARVRDGCYPPRHPWRRDDSGRRQVGAAVLSWVAERVPRRAERQRGFPGARRSARQGAMRRARGAPRERRGSDESKYQVLVIEQDNGHLASVPDLRCQAVGPSAADAIATVQEKARRVLQDFEGATVGPPRPSRLTLALIELPAPSAPRAPGR
jgi:hypothetical protein